MSTDPEAKKGAVEQDRPDQPTNTTLAGQNPHRHKDAVLQGNDTDLPEPGENEEHSMERTVERNPEGVLNDQDPGHRQKRKQNYPREDPLAS